MRACVCVYDTVLESRLGLCPLNVLLFPLITIQAVAKHPVFWDAEQKLKFLLDVSDRLETLSFEDSLVQRLEQGGREVVRGDWRRHICDLLQDDLRRFRQYRGKNTHGQRHWTGA